MINMRVLALSGLIGVSSLSLGAANQAAPGCEAIGNVRFICGHSGPEDLIVVPGGQWVVATSYPVDNGGLRIVNTRDLTTTTLIPSPTLKEQHDRKAYASCPGPIASTEKEKFRTHGISIRPGDRSVHTVYTVHHGVRESVEVFTLDVASNPPTLTWVGCVVAPEGLLTGLNAVAALPDGFIATSPETKGRTKARIEPVNDDITGELWEWHSATGWKMVPESETPWPNGLIVSNDGKTLYVGSTNSASVIRISRGQTPVKRDKVSVGFHVDNVRWAPDGSIYAAGFILGKGPSRIGGELHVAKVDPTTLKVTQLVNAPNFEKFSTSTAAVQVGDDLWVSSVRGDRIAIFPLKPR